MRFIIPNHERSKISQAGRLGIMSDVTEQERKFIPRHRRNGPALSRNDQKANVSSETLTEMKYPRRLKGDMMMAETDATDIGGATSCARQKDQPARLSC
jgi:hypothetical protein